MPYSDIVLVQSSSSPSPPHHYSELVTFLKYNPPKGKIYVDSGSIYSVLLIAAVSPEADIVVSSDYPDKHALRSSFVFNNIMEKLQF